MHGSGSPQAPRLTTGKVVAGLVFILVVVVASLHVAYLLGAITQSFEVAIFGYVLAFVAAVAGLFAAEYRRRGETQKAFVGYRIVAWCFFVAFFGVVQLPYLRELEDSQKQLDRKTQILEQRTLAQQRRAIIAATGAATASGSWLSN